MNTVQLIGRLTRDPEIRFTTGGTATCTIRLAVPRRPRNGEDQPANFVDVVTFGAQAEAIAEHMAKGRRVAVVGRLERREWLADEGLSTERKRSKLEVVASQVDFLDKAPQRAATTTPRARPSPPARSRSRSPAPAGRCDPLPRSPGPGPTLSKRGPEVKRRTSPRPSP